jgi:hypothetical protein
MAPANYADGIGAPISGPAPPRYVSNRIYNDGNQNVFSERGVTHWGVVWGQFLDHSFGLRQVSDEAFPLGFDAADPLEAFSNPNDTMPFTRSAIAPDTGVSTPREQINTVSSYIDAWAVYGGTDERLDWLRAGDTLDGDPTNNDAHLLLNDGYLPTASDRPGTDAPVMEPFGIQFADPTGVVSLIMCASTVSTNLLRKPCKKACSDSSNLSRKDSCQ